MKTPPWLLSLAVLAAGIPFVADGAPAHVHGVATLQVVVDANALELRFDSPLENLVGFERGPRNDKERQQIRDMAQKWQQSGQLFVLTAEARCNVRDVLLSSPVIDPLLLKESAAAAATPPTSIPAPASGHADMNAVVKFHCENPAVLKTIDVRLFASFSRLRQLNVELVSGTKQSAIKLSPRQTFIKW